jgi:hypothetical protein
MLAVLGLSSRRSSKAPARCSSPASIASFAAVRIAASVSNAGDVARPVPTAGVAEGGDSGSDKAKRIRYFATGGRRRFPPVTREWPGRYAIASLRSSAVACT